MTEQVLSKKQRELLETIDHAAADAEFEGATVDPTKIALWKELVMDGMGFEALFEIIKDDREKIVSIRPKSEFRDSPGMKHMGNGYFISGDDPEEPPVK